MCFRPTSVPFHRPPYRIPSLPVFQLGWKLILTSSILNELLVSHIKVYLYCLHLYEDRRCARYHLSVIHKGWGNKAFNFFSQAFKKWENNTRGFLHNTSPQHSWLKLVFPQVITPKTSWQNIKLPFFLSQSHSFSPENI